MERPHIQSVLEDPGAQGLARVYATAFLDAADSVGVEQALEEFESFLVDVLQRNPEFDRLLRSGMLGREERLRLLEQVVAPHASPLFASFLRVLARHDRLDILPVIFRRARQEHEKRVGQGRVQVTSARPLSGENLRTIEQRLAAALPFQPIIETRTDPSLLGGIVIRVGDTVYDGSLRTRMKQLRGRLREGSLHEIQSRRDRFSHPEGD